MSTLNERASKTRSHGSTERVGAGVVVVAGDATRKQRISRLLGAEGINVLARVSAPHRVLTLCAGDPGIVAIIYCDNGHATEAIEQFKRTTPDTRLVLVAGPDGNGRGLRAAMRTSVDAVVYPDDLADALAPTVRAVIAGQVVFPRGERRRVDIPPLSHREKQVLRLAISGLTNDEIGTRLYLATSTVKSHLTSAFMKLEVRSRNEAAALILDPDEPAGRMILAGAGEETMDTPWN